MKDMREEIRNRWTSAVLRASDSLSTPSFQPLTEIFLAKSSKSTKPKPPSYSVFFLSFVFIPKHIPFFLFFWTVIPKSPRKWVSYETYSSMCRQPYSVVSYIFKDSSVRPRCMEMTGTRGRFCPLFLTIAVQSGLQGTPSQKGQIGDGRSCIGRDGCPQPSVTKCVKEKA